MNAEECARLVSLVRTLYPAQRFDTDPQNVVNGWGFVVADVRFDEAHAAVIRLARRGVQWVSPGDVRREVAHGRCVLAPDVDDLLHDVREVAKRDGVGRRQLHPVASKAYDTVGGASAVARMDSRGLLQLRRLLEELAAKHELTVLDNPLPPEQPAHVPIERRIDVTPAIEPTPQPADHAARRAQLRDFLEGGKS